MIPKIIHYCWLSDDPFPELIRLCIDSWKKVLPDYEIKCWNTSNFDVNSVQFVKEAYEKKKWAFAADYIRLFALYTEGGIYLDSDVFVEKRFDDFLDNNAFSAIEYNKEALIKSINKNIVDSKGNIKSENIISIPGLQIQAAVIGSRKHNEYIYRCMKYYEASSFVLKDGTFNNKIIAPDVLAFIARDYGFLYLDKEQDLGQIKIYSSEIFAGHPALANNKTYAIHCCNGTWRDKSILRKCINYFRKNVYLRFIRN